MQPQYDVFISYSRKDSIVKDWLYQRLLEENLTVWVDTLMMPSDSWQESIENALKNSACLVVLVSPNSVQSSGVMNEIHYAQATGKKIIPCIITGDQRNMPYPLAHMHSIDLTADHTEENLSLLIITIKRNLNNVNIEFNGIDTLTPHNINMYIAPYLETLAELQRIIAILQQKPYEEPLIRMISHNSPIEVSVDGLGDAISISRDAIVAWRRKYNKELARLDVSQKRRNIVKTEAEIQEIEVRTTTSKADAELKQAEAQVKRQEAERLRLENEKLKLELHRAKIELALEIIGKFAPTLSEAERIAYITQLLNPLAVLTESPLEIASDD